jgi:glycosyltransferase involved in cell wall biosynthesis
VLGLPMKIIHTVCNYYPSVGGNEQIIQQLSERLVKRGHEVTVLTSLNPERNFEEMNGVSVKQFNIQGTKAIGIRGEIQEYQDFLLNSKFDVLLNYGCNVWTTDLTLDLLQKIDAVKILCPVGHTPLKSPLWRCIYWKYYRDLPKYMKNYDKIVYTSDNYGIKHDYIDKNFGDKHKINNYCIIPNAVSEEEFTIDSSYFRSKYAIDTPFILLNVGYHQHVKGHDFIIRAFEKLNRDDTTLVIIGNEIKTILPIHSCYKKCLKKSEQSHNKIKLLTNVPRKDTVAAFLEADIYLLGSKYECSPVTILEAIASKTPFISTNVGNVSEIKGGVIINNPDEMAYQTGQLLNDEDKRSLLGKMGYKSFYENYRWDEIVKRFEDLYLSLLKFKRTTF